METLGGENKTGGVEETLKREVELVESREQEIATIVDRLFSLSRVPGEGFALRYGRPPTWRSAKATRVPRTHSYER